MTTVSNTSAGNSADILAALNKKNSTATDTNTSTTGSSGTALGQDAFLKLLITQLKNQSPLDPQDNTAFVAQLAQFSSLQGIQNLNTTVSSLSNNMQSSQALQASSLVGRTVEVPTATGYLPKDSYVQGTMSLDNSTANLVMNIYDSKNNLVMTKNLGSQAAGDLPFAWDGTKTDGTTKVDAGTYRFEVLAKGKGDPTKVQTYIGNNVNSVTIGANQAVMLNVNAVGPVALSDVKNIL
ncbi:MAG TPA: flagellar hook assembly protein FlgD [Spongiibacteraceae bacterium]|nr:flagellar hook assembly protein FlgD [Spongiibacteraceae bacterium]